MNHRFEKTLRELASWDFWIETISAQEDLDPAPRETVLKGLAKLRLLFGDDWLAGAVRDRHPILLTLIQQAAWARFQIGEIANKLADLEHVSGFPFLLARMKHSEEFVGALPELYVAWALHAKGLPIELSPTVEDRAPDISIPGNPTIYVEIAIPRLSQTQRKAENVMKNLSLLSIQDPAVAVGGQIHQVLSESLMHEILKQMKHAINQVRTTGRPEEIHKPGCVDLYFAPRTDGVLMEQWTQDEKVDHIVGPWIEPAQVIRLLRVLRDKIKQLPEAGAAIVVIYDTYASLEASRKDLVAELSEIIYKHPKITAALIVTRHLALSTEDAVEVDDTEFGLTLSQPVNRFFREELLVVRNPSARYPLDSQRLLQLFRTYR